MASQLTSVRLSLLGGDLTIFDLECFCNRARHNGAADDSVVVPVDLDDDAALLWGQGDE